MIKMVVTVAKRKDMTTEQFKARWRGEHAALVTRHANDLRMKRYIQSHKIPNQEIEAFAKGRGWTSAPDGLAEVWWDSIEDIVAAFASPEGQNASKILAADEAVFCEMSGMAAFLSEEHVIFDETGT